MKAKEWLFKNYPQVKDDWCKIGNYDNYMVRMMEEYALQQREEADREAFEAGYDAGFLDGAINNPLDLVGSKKAFQDYKSK